MLQLLLLASCAAGQVQLSIQNLLLPSQNFIRQDLLFHIVKAQAVDGVLRAAPVLPCSRKKRIVFSTVRSSSSSSVKTPVEGLAVGDFCPNGRQCKSYSREHRPQSRQRGSDRCTGHSCCTAPG